MARKMTQANCLTSYVSHLGRYICESSFWKPDKWKTANQLASADASFCCDWILQDVGVAHCENKCCSEFTCKLFLKKWGENCFPQGRNLWLLHCYSSTKDVTWPLSSSSHMPLYLSGWMLSSQICIAKTAQILLQRNNVDGWLIYTIWTWRLTVNNLLDSEVPLIPCIQVFSWDAGRFLLLWCTCEYQPILHLAW